MYAKRKSHNLRNHQLHRLFFSIWYMHLDPSIELEGLKNTSTFCIEINISELAHIYFD